METGWFILQGDMWACLTGECVCVCVLMGEIGVFRGGRRVLVGDVGVYLRGRGRRDVPKGKKSGSVLGKVGVS